MYNTDQLEIAMIGGIDDGEAEGIVGGDGVGWLVIDVVGVMCGNPLAGPSYRRQVIESARHSRGLADLHGRRTAAEHRAHVVRAPLHRTHLTGETSR